MSRSARLLGDFVRGGTRTLTEAAGASVRESPTRSEPAARAWANSHPRVNAIFSAGVSSRIVLRGASLPAMALAGNLRELRGQEMRLTVYWTSKHGLVLHC